MKITVLSLLRDSEKSLPEFFGHLEALEKEHPDDELEYYLYENDSRDNTVKLVKEWLKDREGDLLSEKLQAIKWNSTTPAGKRMMFMAECRQKLLDFARPLKSDWLFLVDADIEYKPNIIKEYLKCKEDNIVMYTPNGGHNIKCAMCGCKKWAYYDTQAFEDIDGNRGMLITCNPLWSKEDRALWNDNKPIKVRMAFGGAALIKSSAANKSNYLPCQGFIDHEAFIKGLEGDIMVFPHITTFTTVSTEDKSWHDGERERNKHFLKDPWFLWKRRTQDESMRIKNED